MKTILLKFSGPMQAWGTSSHFETRHTDFYPAKSAVIGVIAASMGYRRDDTDNIQKLNELQFAVRIDQKGNLLRDYHIAKKYKDNGDFERNYVTNRYYLEDAVFVVALTHKDDVFVDKLIEGLRNPYFQPYMGRRALSVGWDFIVAITEKDVLSSIEHFPWQAADWYKVKYGQKIQSLEVFADANIVRSAEKKIRKDHVLSFSQKDRKFTNRYETRLIVPITQLVFQQVSTEHDAFGNIGV